MLFTPSPKVLKSVAVFEAAKGGMMLLAGLGVAAALRRGARHEAEAFIRHLHLNPADHYPRLFIDLASRLGNGRLWLLGAFAVAYAMVRFAEAYGLWQERRWAEWFAALSGGLYLPFELYELFVGISWIKALVFAVNLGIVAYMAATLARSRAMAGGEV